MLRYNRLPHPVFTDTMFAGTKSKRGNKCAQIFCTDYGWTRCFPMVTKGQAHEACSLVFQRDGVPPKMIMDGSKEQATGKFAKKCREADCHAVTTEPYSPWQQAAEGCIKQVKLGSSRKMLKSASPKPLWDHCLEYEGGIRSHTALDIYGLFGQVPETVMTGQTGDISAYCEFEWFQWVMYYEPTECYPNGKPQIGRWLGPAPDVGIAVTYKILKT